MLHLSNFRKAYQQQVVLQVEVLTIPAGIYWLRGRNGAGKSTLLKALAGMTSFEGEITLQPNVNRWLPRHHQRIGWHGCAAGPSRCSVCFFTRSSIRNACRTQ